MILQEYLNKDFLNNIFRIGGIKLKVRRFFAVLLSLLIVLLSCGTAMATNTDEETYNGWIPDEYERLSPSVYDGEWSVPEKYDPRQDGILTDVKDQGQTKLCWMFAASGAVENYASKYYGSKFDISEAHGAVASSNSIGSGENGYYYVSANSGGNNAKALQYLTNWNTPIFNDDVCNWRSTVAESKYPLSKITDNLITLTDEDFTEAESLLNVTNAQYLSIRNAAAVKHAIMEYGSVVTGIWVPNIFGVDYNGDYNAYNNGAGATNHAVMIVGWDDSYSKNNFLGDTKPQSDGAWLIKNSYSSAGYFWLSYSDTSLYSEKNSVAVITGVQKSNNDEHMLSYDYFTPEYNSSVVFRDKVYFCNVFDISGYTASYNQINKVMFYLRSTGCDYSVKIVQLDNNGNIPGNVDNYSALAQGSYDGEGYLTVNLTTPYYFTSNNKCAVIVELTPPDNKRIYLPYEGNVSKTGNMGSPLLSPEINSGESYYGTKDSNNNIVWKDCDEDNTYGDSGHKGNLIIRPVLKKTNSTDTDISITPDSIIPSDEDVNIQITGNTTLFSIHTSTNYILREDKDYSRTGTGIILKESFINSLNGAYTNLVFEFNNDTTKNVIVNPKSVLSRVEISGDPVIGETLSAVCYGVPPKDEYDVTYQWYSSPDGNDWYKIGDAESKDYTVGGNVKSQYIKVEVTAERFGNVEYPTVMCSEKTNCKAVVLGDVNLDGNVSVLDVTEIQKYLAHFVTLNSEQLLAADFNRDGYITVMDVTRLQQYLTL